MKKIIKAVFMLAIIFFMAYGTASAQFIKIRPARTVVVRTHAPSPRHVWVDEDWEWRNNTYVSKGGYWVEPPRAGAAWVPGHWKREGRRGERWIPGHWR
jgi:hypothetical protein